MTSADFAPFAWPLAGCIITISGLLLFRSPIIRLLDRIKGAKTPWGDIDATSRQAEQQEALEKTTTSESPLLDMFDNALLKVQEDRIRNDPLLEAEIDPQRRERVLIRHLAAQQILVHFERIYSAIWGSQLAALRALSELPAGATEPDAAKYFEEVRQRHGDAYQEVNFNAWTSFLEKTGLVQKIDRTYHITLIGREFLKYLIEMGYTQNKAL